MTSIRSHRIIAFLLFISLSLSAVLSFSSCGKQHKHEWGEWEPYIESTCYIAGQERSLCTCGAAKYRRVALAHEFELESVDLSEKTMTMVCPKCSTEEVRELTSDVAHIALITIDDAESGLLTVERGENTFTASFTDLGGGAYSLSLNDGASSLADGAGEFSDYMLTPGYLGQPGSYGAIAAELYGNVVRSRNYTDLVSTAVNGGAGAGYPAALYIAGKFGGICTLTPTDASSGAQASILALAATEQTELRNVIDTVDGSGFKIVYTADGFGDEAALQSFNEMISFVSQNDWDDFRDGLAAHVNFDRAADEMLFACVAGDAGCVAANILWTTYDGTVWIPVPYKLDNSFENGASPVEPDHDCNLLWEKLNLYMAEDLNARWRDLRYGPLALDSIEGTVRAHFDRIPQELLALDEKLASEVSECREKIVAAVMETVNSNLARLDVFYVLQ